MKEFRFPLRSQRKRALEKNAIPALVDLLFFLAYNIYVASCILL